MEDPNEIQSAVSAMQALQERIDQMEKENSILRHDIAILRLDQNATNTESYNEETQLNENADALAIKLSTAADLLTDLRQIRRQKAEMQEINKEIEIELGNELRKGIILDNKMKLLSAKLNDVLASEDEFDSILLNYILPPPIKCAPKLDLKFNLINESTEPKTKSGKFQSLLKEVQMLPATTRGEKLESKKKIFATLKNVKDRISQLEQEKKAIEESSQPKSYKEAKVQSKLLQIQALQAATNRFH